MSVSDLDRRIYPQLLSEREASATLLVMKKFSPQTLALTLTLGLTLTACGGNAEETTRPPKGNPNAEILVEEFADLQCPGCRNAHTSIAAPIVEKYGDSIRFEHKHFPLRSIHRFALDASEMAECAADQGKFWEFIDHAFENQGDLNHEVLPTWAEEIGLDVAKAERCWKSHSKRKTVLADYKEGREREVSGTPTFFVNGEKVETGFDTISAAIEKALKGASMPL